MLNKNLRVYRRKLDNDGNEIERGVDEREYKTLGRAYKRGFELFGDHGEQKNIEWTEACRDPWEEYTRKVTCGACGQTYVAKEKTYNTNITILHGMVHLCGEFDGKKHNVDIHKPICPDCHEKIYNFIKGLNAKHEPVEEITYEKYRTMIDMAEKGE